MSNKLGTEPDARVCTQKIRYLTVRETLHSEESGEYVSYGISVRKEEREIAFVSDVSTQRDLVERLVWLCNQNGLYPEHLQDVVQDLIVEESLNV